MKDVIQVNAYNFELLIFRDPEERTNAMKRSPLWTYGTALDFRLKALERKKRWSPDDFAEYRVYSLELTQHGNRPEHHFDFQSQLKQGEVMAQRGYADFSRQYLEKSAEAFLHLSKANLADAGEREQAYGEAQEILAEAYGIHSEGNVVYIDRHVDQSTARAA